MPLPGRELEDLVLTRVVRLNAVVQGIAAGTIVAAAVFVATNWLVVKGGPVVGPHLALLSQFFIGYRVSFVGSLIGASYGFLVGFVAGWATAWIYNQVADRRDSRPV